MADLIAVLLQPLTLCNVWLCYYDLGVDCAMMSYTGLLSA